MVRMTAAHTAQRLLNTLHTPAHDLGIVWPNADP